MLSCLDDDFYEKDLGHQLTPSTDNADQRILQFDWARSMTCHNQPKWYFQTQPWLDDHSHAKNLRYQFINSRYNDDHRILLSDWTRGMASHNQPKKVVSYTTFFSWLDVSKNLRYQLIPFGDCWSKNPVIWLGKRQNCPNQPNMEVSDTNFNW